MLLHHSWAYEDAVYLRDLIYRYTDDFPSRMSQVWPHGSILDHTSINLNLWYHSSKKNNFGIVRRFFVTWYLLLVSSAVSGGYREISSLNTFEIAVASLEVYFRWRTASFLGLNSTGTEVWRVSPSPNNHLIESLYPSSLLHDGFWVETLPVRQLAVAELGGVVLSGIKPARAL
jgi:hypothetical protein